MKFEIKKELDILISLIYFEEIKFPHNENNLTWQNRSRMITNLKKSI